MSTSAVAVLAQGLRSLRDNAEGPDGEELLRVTGLDATTIEGALAGDELPTLEVTLALVEAWDGDVGAWRAYWGQIAALVQAAVAEEEEKASELRQTQEEEEKVGELREAREEDRNAEEEERDQEREAEPREGPVAEPDAIPAIPMPPESPAIAEAPAPKQPNRKARVGIAVALVVLGAAGGAYGYHALTSKDHAKPQSAAVPGQPSSATSGAPSTPSAQPSNTKPSSATATASGEESATQTPTLTPTQGSTSSIATPAATPGESLGSASGIQLASGYSIDFLNDPTHPVVGTEAGPDTMGFYASSATEGRFYAARAVVFDPGEPDGYYSCLNDTRYQRDVQLSQLSAGSRFCVHTETGKLALVTVERMPSASDANPYAVVDVAVWQGR